MSKRNSEIDIITGWLMAQMMRKREKQLEQMMKSMNSVAERKQQQSVSQSVRHPSNSCAEFSIDMVKYRAEEKEEPDWAEAERYILNQIETLRDMIQYKNDFESPDTECGRMEEKMKAFQAAVLALRMVQEMEKRNPKAD